MIDKISWLGKKEELEFRKLKFNDERAGKIYLYSNYVDGLIRTRAIILIMSVLVLFPSLISLLISNALDFELLLGRIISGTMFLISGIFFNKYRIPSIILGIIPVLFLIATFLFIPSQFNLKMTVYAGAILFLISSGFYYNFKVKKLQKELELGLLENQLIEIKKENENN